MKWEALVASRRQRKLQALQWHRAGLTFDEIAARFGVCRQQAWTLVKQAEKTERQLMVRAKLARRAYLEELRAACLARPV